MVLLALVQTLAPPIDRGRLRRKGRQLATPLVAAPGLRSRSTSGARRRCHPTVPAAAHSAPPAALPPAGYDEGDSDDSDELDCGGSDDAESSTRSYCGIDGPGRGKDTVTYIGRLTTASECGVAIEELDTRRPRSPRQPCSGSSPSLSAPLRRRRLPGQRPQRRRP